MANLFGKAFVKIVTTGASVVGRAFMQAFREASKERGAQAASGSGKSFSEKMSMSNQIKLDEARAILNVDAKAGYQEVTKNFEKMFEANDPTKGGSFYLQSKVFRAKERLEKELAARQNAGGGAPPAE